jgi:cytochrome b6-f complex iron-sulfur subunit
MTNIKIKKIEAMPRGAFLRELGMSSAALMAFYCMGTSSCTSATDTPAPVVVPPVNTSAITGNADGSKGAINFTIDLTATDYKVLKTEGKFVVVGDVIVANAKGNKIVALAKACTHQGTVVEYRLNNDDFWCNNHGSVFLGDGKVKTGPATTALTVYKTQLSTDGNKLTVNA